MPAGRKLVVIDKKIKMSSIQLIKKIQHENIKKTIKIINVIEIDVECIYLFNICSLINVIDSLIIII